jgi:MbtH protein
MSNPDFSLLLVVVNREGQHSIWPKERPLPLGWQAEGFSGSRENCLAHIKQVWLDMTPKSVARSRT